LQGSCLAVCNNAPKLCLHFYGCLHLYVSLWIVTHHIQTFGSVMNPNETKVFRFPPTRLDHYITTFLIYLITFLNYPILLHSFSHVSLFPYFFPPVSLFKKFRRPPFLFLFTYKYFVESTRFILVIHPLLLISNSVHYRQPVVKFMISQQLSTGLFLSKLFNIKFT